MRTFILASLVLAVTSVSSFAGTPLINARQNAQQHRIFKGVQQGDLNFNETQKLLQGQARVQNLENQAKANGVVTPLERARIHAAQNIQSGRIFRRRASACVPKVMAGPSPAIIHCPISPNRLKPQCHPSFRLVFTCNESAR